MIRQIINGNPILVTGSHRSGSTWLGKMLSISKRVTYTHEPFNLNNKYKNSPIKYWFEYVSNTDSDERQKEYYNYINNIIGFPLNLLTTDLIKAERIKSQLSLIKNRLTHRYLIKDPISILSADWLADKFKMDVVVIIRHPAAFVASLKVKDWYYDFNHLLCQDNLMKNVLSDFEKEIYLLSNKEKNIIEHGILLWNLIHYRIKEYQQIHKNWIFVRHEDLSNNPIEEFNKLYDKLGLAFNSDIQKEIIKSTEKNGEKDLVRNSKENTLTWKSRLTKEEIAKIKRETNTISSCFYNDNEW